MKSAYTITTTIVGDIIKQEVRLDDLFSKTSSAIAREIMDTREQKTREALIMLGWSPPASVT